MVGALRGAWLAGLLILVLPRPSVAFYIPGWSIKSYKDGERVPLLVNKIYSDNTQLQYAYHELPFVCKPMGRRSAGGGLLSGRSISLNLGEVLRGDRIVASDMELLMGKDQPCVPLCTKTFSRQDIRRAYDLVRDGYVAEWIVDNLSGATSFVTSDRTKKYYAAGFKLGYTEVASNPRYFLYNHHTIVIRYRKASGRDGEAGRKLIVGFEVYPKSIGHGTRRNSSGCPADLQHVDEGLELRPSRNRTEYREARPTSLPSVAGTDREEDLSGEASLSVPYTYSVYFREDDSIEWAHRWDLYFVNQDEGSRIHWLAIVNSLIICWLLTGIVIIILARTVRIDIRGYNTSSNNSNEANSDDGKPGKKDKSGSRRRFRAGVLTPREKTPGLLDQADGKSWEAEESAEEEDEFGAANHGGRPRAAERTGHAEPQFPRRFRQRRRRAVRLGRPILGLLLGARLQELRGDRLPQERAGDGAAVPRSELRPGLHPQPLRVGPGVEHGDAIRDAAGDARALARHPIAAGTGGLALWVPEGRRVGASDGDGDGDDDDDHYYHQGGGGGEADEGYGDGDGAAAGAAAGVVHPVTAVDPVGRADPVRRHLHRAALRLPVGVAGQERLLLRLRLPGGRVGGATGDGGRGDGGDHLHPAVLREPRVVVAVLPGGRRQRRLGVWLLHLVLRLQAAHQWRVEQLALLRLQLHGLLRVRAADGHCRLPQRLRLCAADLRGYQGRLNR